MSHACALNKKAVTLHSLKWVLRWLVAINTLMKSDLAFSLEEVGSSF